MEASEWVTAARTALEPASCFEHPTAQERGRKRRRHTSQEVVYHGQVVEAHTECGVRRRKAANILDASGLPSNNCTQAPTVRHVSARQTKRGTGTVVALQSQSAHQWPLALLPSPDRSARLHSSYAMQPGHLDAQHTAAYQVRHRGAAWQSSPSTAAVRVNRQRLAAGRGQRVVCERTCRSTRARCMSQRGDLATCHNVGLPPQTGRRPPVLLEFQHSHTAAPSAGSA
jgi:hypothetical protein